MTRRSRIHLDAGDERELALAAGKDPKDVDALAGMHRTACGRPFVDAAIVTADPEQLTCKACRKLSGARAEPEPEAFVPGPPKPAPEPQVWDARARRIAEDSRAGDDRHRPDGWATLDAALADWFETRQRSKVRTSQLVQGAEELATSERGYGRPTTDRGLLELHAHVMPVERAIENAAAEPVRFAGGEGGTGALELGARELRAIVWWFQAGKGARDIADRIAVEMRLADVPCPRCAGGEARARCDRCAGAGTIGPISDRQIGLAWRTMRKRIGDELYDRELLARAPRVEENRRDRGATIGEEDAMATVPGHDIEGTKDAASYLGISEATVKRGIARVSHENPIPVTRYLGKLWFSRAQLDAWRTREMRSNVA